MTLHRRPRILPPAPQTAQPNVFLLEWEEGGSITYELFELTKREAWEPAWLSWEGLAREPVSAEERLGIGYWFALLGIFAAAPPVFAHALVEMYKAHEEDGVRKCFSTILRYIKAFGIEFPAVL